MTSLPKTVADYVAACNASDTDAAVRCFAPDAVVVDENRERAGQDAIRAWIEESSALYSPRLAVKSASQVGNKLVMRAEVSGSFPGSPVVLRFNFELGDGLVTRLHIEV